MSVKIYAVRNQTSDVVYVGSTKQTLAARLRGHKKDAKYRPGHCASERVVLCSTCFIELLEECDEGVRYEREGHWVDKELNCVNRNMPSGRGKAKADASFHLKNKESRNAYNRAYYRANKEKWAVYNA